MLRKGFPGAELANRPGGELVAARPEGFTPVTMDGHADGFTGPLRP